MSDELDRLLLRHQRDLVELLELINEDDEINPRVEQIVDRCCGHVVELIQLLEARDPSSAPPDGTRQSITKLMQLQALSEDAVRQEHERLAREIRLAQQMRQHLLSNLPQQPDSDSCDLRG